jgi:sodium transport system permease protein
VLTGSHRGDGVHVDFDGRERSVIGGSLLMGGGAKAKAGAVAAAGATAAKGAATGAGAALPMLDPLGRVGVLAMVLPVAVLFSAAAFTMALFAKSYKEAQSYLGPMIIVVIMPAWSGCCRAWS